MPKWVTNFEAFAAECYEAHDASKKHFFVLEKNFYILKYHEKLFLFYEEIPH